MAGLPLSGTPFYDLLPASIRDDAQMTAAAEVLDRQFAVVDPRVPLVLIWSRIDVMAEPLLSNLAYQLHLEGYEGWHLAETLEQKRALLKESIILHFRKGTRWSVERAFELLDMRGIITEWWEAPDDPYFFPYEFDIDIEAVRPITEQLHRDLIELVFALKNVRSHLRKYRIHLTNQGKIPKIAAALVSGVVTTVYPFAPLDVEFADKKPVVAGGAHKIDVFTIYPLEAS